MPKIGETWVTEWRGFINGKDGGLWRLTGVRLQHVEDGPPKVTEYYVCVAVVFGISGGLRNLPPARLKTTWEYERSCEMIGRSGAVWRIDAIEVRNLSNNVQMLTVFERWKIVGLPDVHVQPTVLPRTRSRSPPG